MLLVKLAWRNIGRGWRRSAVVLSSITVGLVAAILLLAWMKGMIFQMADNAIRMHLAHLAIQAPGYQQNPDVQRNLGARASELLSIAEQRSDLAASPRVRGDGLVQSVRRSLRVAVVGVDPLREARVSVVPHQIVAGEFLIGGSRPRSRQLPPIVIGLEMATRLRVDLGDKVVLHVPGETGLGAFRIRGLYRTSSTEFDRSVAYMHRPDALELFAVDGPSEIAIALDDPERGVAVQAWLRSKIPGERAEVLRWQEREPRLASMLEIAGSTSWIFYSLIFIAMAFGIANALLMAVYERIREFGVLRSLGLNSQRLVLMILLEALLLTIVGAGLGLAIGWPLVAWLSEVGIDMSWFSAALEGWGIGAIIYPRTDAWDLVSPLVLAVVTGVIAAAWPALKAARLRPAEALRAV